MYIKLSDSTYPVSLAEIRAANSEDCIPDDAQTEAVEHYGYARVQASPRPQVDLYESVTEAKPVLIDSKWVQQWLVAALPADQIAHAERIKAKSAREAAVAAITVEVNGKVFDGDEISQTRMARAVLVSQIAGVTETVWTLANNESVPVTVQELQQALALAGQKQAELWVLPL